MPPDPSQRTVIRGSGANESAVVSEELQKSSYGQILKSTALVGGSSVLILGIGLIRTKAVALLMGPSGLGLMGLYSSVVDLALSVAGLGIGSSGVRQVADAVGRGDTDRVARVVTVLRRASLVLAVIGAIVIAMFAARISQLTFGSQDYVGGIALLSLVVFFRLVSAGQGALLQGMRRIADLALSGLLGATASAIAIIGFVYFWKENGIAPALVVGAALGASLTWWFSRRIHIDPPAMTRDEIGREAGALVQLGFAFLVSATLMMGSAYVVRLIVTRMEGLEAAGLYQAAWVIGGMYVGVVLQAMGADFYPRLTAAISDERESNRLVNEQTYISLLLAAPGVLATLTFAPFVMTLFYSAEFVEATELLRWICLGIGMRVITWPIGYIIVAANNRMMFILTELAWTVVNVGLTLLFVKSVGLKGAGIAFFLSYVFHCLMIYPIVRRLNGFRWSSENLRTGLVFVASAAIAFCGFVALPSMVATTLGTAIMILVGIRSINALACIASTENMPRRLRRFVALVSRKKAPI